MVVPGRLAQNPPYHGELLRRVFVPMTAYAMAGSLNSQ